jgi:hypothetical protein
MGESMNKQIKQEMTEEEKEKREEILAAIAAQLPPIIFSNWRGWRDVLPISPGTVKNDESLGVGPKDFVFVGRVKGRTRESMIEYLRGKVRFTA